MVVGTVFEVVVIFVLAEAVPKNWAVHNPDRAALFTAPIVSAVVRFPPVRAVSTVLIGLANLLIGRRSGDEEWQSNVTESELLAMADVAHAEDVIETDERALIHSIIEFGDTVVREVMVPRPDMLAPRGRHRRCREALERGHGRRAAAACRSTRTTSTTSSGIAYAKDLMRGRARRPRAATRCGRTCAPPTSSPRPSG